MPGTISVIVPALDEAHGIARCLEALAPLRALGHEVVVVDGGSADATRALAAPLADRVLEAPRGRARQMNAGAAAARGDVLLFLHADTRLPPRAERAVLAALAGGAHAWGRFDVAIDSRSPLLALVGFFMSLRSRLTGIATGDQAIFARRDALERAGGFPDIALMEDVAFSARMKRLSRPACLRERVLTSDRRWRRHGTLPTILLMWRLRLAYFLGADPEELARRYAKPG
ncbi:MAG: TIGR04283 family arsenosugar biosynthesis glycosyltransferase [Betaproteobacteria bacterium]|nr:TIGR04283 family arsenosugar biosynthesis glycosyltransferase [Betaproteobacteria bacterium]